MKYNIRYLFNCEVNSCISSYEINQKDSMKRLYFETEAFRKSKFPICWYIKNDLIYYRNKTLFIYIYLSVLKLEVLKRLTSILSSVVLLLLLHLESEFALVASFVSDVAPLIAFVSINAVCKKRNGFIINFLKFFEDFV